MALLTLENVGFRYDETTVLQNVSFTIEEGSFVALCGTTGSGKSTLLRLLKKELRPAGLIEGEIAWDGEPIDAYPASDIGFIMQQPAEQLTMERVWQELAFPLENLQLPHHIMEQRIAEVLHFMGIHDLFDRRVDSLSGGQQQLVNLAVCLMTNPRLLLLDEPTSQLDPFAAMQFLRILDRIHRELGITIIIAEHRLEELVNMIDEVLFLQNQKTELQLATRLLLPKLVDHPLLKAFGAAPYIYLKTGGNHQVPLNVSEARRAFSDLQLNEHILPSINPSSPMLTANSIYFRFEKKGKDVLNGLDLQLGIGEILAVVGGNGAGKSTLLQVLAGLRKPYKGKITCQTASKEPFSLMPQNPVTIFSHDTVAEELDSLRKVAHEGYEERREEIIDLLEIRFLLEENPSALSGGQQQLVAFAKVYCLGCPVMLMDEPTKGLDVQSKQLMQLALAKVRTENTSVIVVTHDLDFAAESATHCAMLFQGRLTAIQPTHIFFSNNHFYTTTTCRIMAQVAPGIVTCDEAVRQINKKGVDHHA